MLNLFEFLVIFTKFELVNFGIKIELGLISIGVKRLSLKKIKNLHQQNVLT